MKMNIGKLVNVPQGSDLWLALRSKRKTASEAPAAAGKSKYQTRNGLLDQKATGLVPEVSSHQQRIYDEGHHAEAEARPLAENLIDDDLFPVVLDDPEGGFLASMDGLTMDRKIGFEHKLYSEALAKQIDAGELEEHYMLQLDQQFALSGAEKILFVASDGTEEKFKYLWVERDESRFAALESVWEQFEKDLANHTPAETAAEKPVGNSPEALPALVIHAKGEVTASNLQDFEKHARAVIAGIKTDLVTDQDFADAEQTVKFCKKAEERLSASKDAVLAQTASLDEVFRTIDSVSEDLRQTRLKLEKSVKAQKESRKAEIVTTANKALDNYIQALRDEHGIVMPVINADFPGVIKGKKNLNSMQSAVDDEMARAKIEADQAASLIRGNLAQVNEHAADCKFLFNDFGQICMKPADDFAAIVKSRIADYQAEQARKEAEQKAQQEVADKAKADAVADPAPETKKADPAERPSAKQETMPNPNDMVKVIADHYGVSFQKAASWLASVEWRVAA